MAMVNVPGGIPELGALIEAAGISEVAAARYDEVEELVVVGRVGVCFAEADLKGIVSVTIAITVVVFVAAGRLGAGGVAEGCARPLAGLTLSPAETGDS